MYTCRCLRLLKHTGNIRCHGFAGAHAVHELLSHDCQNRAFEGNTRFHQPPPQDVFQRGLLQLHLVQFLLAIQHILLLSVPLSSLRLCVVCPHRDSSVVRVCVCMDGYMYVCIYVRTDTIVIQLVVIGIAYCCDMTTGTVRILRHWKVRTETCPCSLRKCICPSLGWQPMRDIVGRMIRRYSNTQKC